MHPITLTFFTPKLGKPLFRPLIAFRVPAGFPSPADDHLEARIDLNEHLIRHPTATFFARVSGDSMTGAGILDGDMLIIDRAADIPNNCIVVARIEDRFTLKRIKKAGKRIFLVPENELFPPIELTEESDCEIWGRVVGITRKY